MLSPSPEQIEYAEMLLRRAQGDLHVCRKLADDIEIDDSIIGFHAQQRDGRKHIVYIEPTATG